MHVKRQAILFLLARFWIGGLFSFSGWIKAVEPYENFRGILAQYALIPAAAVPWIAGVFPWLELMTGVFLLAGYALPFCALSAAVLSGGLLLLIGSSKLFGFAMPAECGCFGAGFHFSPAQMLGVDGVSTVLALMFFFRKESFLSMDALLSKKRSR